MMSGRRRLWLWILLGGGVAFVLFAGASLFLARHLYRIAMRPGVDQLRGGVLEYRLLFPSGYAGNRDAAQKQTLDVVRSRLRAQGLKKFRVVPFMDDRIRVEFDGLTSEEFRRCKGLLTFWNVELREVAPVDVRRSWKNGAAIPDGYEAVQNDRPKDGGFD